MPSASDYPGFVIFAIVCIAAASIGVFLWLLHRETRRRQSRNARRCVVCGYDLRASPESCPECGMPVALNKLRVPLNAARLNKQWPSERIDPRKPARDERMACVQAAEVAQHAHLLANQLRARGIWVEVRPGPEDCVLVLVPNVDADQAQAIVATFRLDRP